MFAKKEVYVLTAFSLRSPGWKDRIREDYPDELDQIIVSNDKEIRELFRKNRLDKPAP